MISKMIGNFNDSGENYPKLMIISGCSLIVLFNCDQIGSVVYPGDSDWAIGSYSNEWQMDQFQEYIGTVQLSNN